MAMDALPVMLLLGRSVPLLLLAKLLFLLAGALSAHMASMTTVYALLVLLVLLPVQLERLISLLACARLTGMEMLKLPLISALHVISVVPVLLKADQPPQYLLLACAQRTPTEMVPRATSALLTLLRLLLLIQMALPRLPRLLAIASLTFTEMPEPTHALLAPMAVYLLLRRHQLPPQL